MFLGDYIMEERVLGLQEVNKKLEQIPVKLQKKLIRQALRKGVNIFRDAARQVVPKKTGKLRRAIKSASAKSSKDQIGMKVGIDYKIARYGTVVEFGSRPHEIKAKKGKLLSNKSDIFGRSVKHPGQKPSLFMKSAYEGASGKAIKAFEDEMKTNFDLEVGGK